MQLSKDLNLIFLIVVTLIFFSLNSIFCKVALSYDYIDAYSFTFLRVFFACITLILLVLFKSKELTFSFKSNWLSSFMLFIYLIGFSYAYLGMDAGFGALLLFGTVQIVMIISSFFRKESISVLKIIGVIVAFLGLVYLLLPKEQFEISYFHVALMVLSGMGWAGYSILGKSSNDALFNTMDNFLKATFFVMITFSVLFVDSLNISFDGFVFAFLSGSLTSAIGYMIWYFILPKIQVFTASVVQLFVPIIAVLLSVLFLDEIFTYDILVSILLISVGVVLAVIPKREANQSI